jgi:hypothetical protein
MLPTAFQVSGLISEIGVEGAPESEQPSRDLPDPVLGLLVGLKFRKEEKSRRAECAALIAERIELNERTKVFIEAQAKRQHEEMLAQIEDCCQRGAEQEKVIAGLQRDIGRLLGAINDADSVLSKARVAWTDAVDARKRTGRWATADTIKKADERIARAQAKFKEADAEKSACMQAHNQVALVDMPPEKEKLRNLVYELERLKAMLRGDKNFCDPEFGIISPAGEIPLAAA